MLTLKVSLLRPGHTEGTHGERTASALEICNFGPVRCRAPNFCRSYSELTPNAWRVASALSAYRAHTVRIQTVHRAHMITTSTNAQRVASALDEWSTHAPRCTTHGPRIGNWKRPFA